MPDLGGGTGDYMIRCATFVAATFLSTLAGVTPAAVASSPVYPSMYFDPVVTIKDSRGRITGYKLCAHGDASFLYVFGAWSFRMDGTRASLSGSAGPTVSENDSRSGTPTYNGCLTVYRLGYQTGHVQATFAYDGVGGDMSYSIEHTFTWCQDCPNPSFVVDIDDVEEEIRPL